uniref:Uncharacterized protein n=1 Tax=Rhizophora mucronata TaxID=61149 RepID=A0A2P2Q7V5_RHIMU
MASTVLDARETTTRVFQFSPKSVKRKLSPVRPGLIPAPKPTQLDYHHIL